MGTHQAGCWSQGCGGETAEGLGLTTTGFRWRAELVGSVWTASSPQCCRPVIGPRKRHYGNRRESMREVRLQFPQTKAEGDICVGKKWNLWTRLVVDWILQENAVHSKQKYQFEFGTWALTYAPCFSMFKCSYNMKIKANSVDIVSNYSLIKYMHIISIINSQADEKWCYITQERPF